VAAIPPPKYKRIESNPQQSAIPENAMTVQPSKTRHRLSSKFLPMLAGGNHHGVVTILAFISAISLSPASLSAADIPATPGAAVPKEPVSHETSPKQPKTPVVIPQVEKHSYGPHPRQMVYFWKAKFDKPTPVLVFFHGGSWAYGDYRTVSGMLQETLAAGISVVSVEYRFLKDATEDGLVPPVKGPMLDCARALQFVRSKAKEWNLDKTRVATAGSSAGACTSLWLAFHDDLADPKSDDPIARESTRVTCATADQAQDSLDPKHMGTYGWAAFGTTPDSSKGKRVFDEEGRQRIMPWIKEYSPYELVSKDDPAIGLYYPNPPDPGNDAKGGLHSTNFGVRLKARCDEHKSPCELVYPGAPDVKYKTPTEFIIGHLLR